MLTFETVSRLFAVSKELDGNQIIPVPVLLRKAFHSPSPPPERAKPEMTVRSLRAFVNGRGVIS